MLNLTNSMSEWTHPFELFQGQNLLDPVQLATLMSSAPTAAARLIAVEDPDYEKQYRMNLCPLVECDQLTREGERLPPPWRELLSDLMGLRFTQWLEKQTRQELVGLPRCVGAYAHRAGDYLSVHKDKFTKAITAILYLNTDWPAESGGTFQLFSSGEPGATPESEISPLGGQLIAFKPTETSWHAVSPVSRKDGVERVTVQVEYWLSTELRGSAYKPAATNPGSGKGEAGGSRAPRLHDNG